MECIDRLYLNAFQPRLQYRSRGCGVLRRASGCPVRLPGLDGSDQRGVPGSSHRGRRLHIDEKRSKRSTIARRVGRYAPRRRSTTAATTTCPNGCVTCPPWRRSASRPTDVRSTSNVLPGPDHRRNRLSCDRRLDRRRHPTRVCPTVRLHPHPSPAVRRDRVPYAAPRVPQRPFPCPAGASAGPDPAAMTPGRTSTTYADHASTAS